MSRMLSVFALLQFDTCITVRSAVPCAHSLRARLSYSRARKGEIPASATPLWELQHRSHWGGNTCGSQPRPKAAASLHLPPPAATESTETPLKGVSLRALGSRFKPANRLCSASRIPQIAACRAFRIAQCDRPRTVFQEEQCPRTRLPMPLAAGGGGCL